MTELTLDRDRFAAWLRARGREEIGIPGNSCLCPIARWIRADLGMGWLQVKTDDEGVYVDFLDGPTRSIKTGRHSWLYRFISRVDDEPPMPVRADRALEILDQDEEEDWYDA
jgi:hypothetical protein